MTCVNCHSIHGTQSASNNKEIKGAQFAAAPYTTTARQLAYKRCVACHRDVRGEILKPSHHPIIEGKVGCQDCHDPHGALQKASLRNESINDLCVSCHADKRGPWIHEHPPVDGELRHLPHAARLVAQRALLAQKPPALCARLPSGRPHARHLRRTRDAAQRRCRRTSASKAAAASTAIGRSTAATRRHPPTANSSSAETRGQS